MSTHELSDIAFSADADYHARSGLEMYDSARWLLPPPLITHNLTSHLGLGFLIQLAQSNLPAKQEVIVDAPDHNAIIIFTGSATDCEWHVGGAIKRVERNRGIAVMGSDPSRWVSGLNLDPVIHFHYPRVALSSLLPDQQCRDLDPAFFVPDAATNFLIDALLMDLSIDRVPDLMLVESYAILLLRRLSGIRVHPIPVRGGLAPWQIRKIDEYLEANVSKKVSIADLARLVDLSPFHFARAFQRSTGSAPHAYYADLKMKRAKELLQYTDMSIFDVALELDYSAQHFARAFFRATGCTPSKWRNRTKG